MCGAMKESRKFALQEAGAAACLVILLRSAAVDHAVLAELMHMSMTIPANRTAYRTAVLMDLNVMHHKMVRLNVRTVHVISIVYPDIPAMDPDVLLTMFTAHESMQRAVKTSVQQAKCRNV